MLDVSICHFRGVKSILSPLFYFLMENPVSKQCLPSETNVCLMTLLQVSR